MTSLILIGGGGHAKSVIDVVESTGKFHIVGIVDTPARVGQKCLDYPIIGTDADLAHVRQSCTRALITIGQIQSSDLRVKIFGKLKQLNFILPQIISPSARVSKYARLGAGTVVMHGSIINAGAEIGVNCIINSQCLIEHDAQVGDHCHISTGARVNGGVRVGAQTFVGSGAILRDNIQVGSNVLIGMGAKVFKSVADGEKYI